MAIDIETSRQINEGMAALVADGEWHPFWKFLPILECVPPEHAVRIFLGSKGRPDKPLDEQISRGRREMLRQRLNNIVRRGTWECTPISRSNAQRGDGFDRQYRLTPEGAIPKPTPAKPTPAKPTPAKPTPAKPTPAKPTPAKPTPAKPTPAKPTPAKPTSAKPTPAKLDTVEEACKVAQKIMALPSTKHFSGVELKDYLAYVAQLLLIKATKVKA